MKMQVCFVLLALAVALCVKSSEGSYNCVGCTMLVGIVLEFVEFNNVTVEKGMEMLCSYFPGEFGETCKELVDIFELPLLIILEETSHPDRICRNLTFCKGEEAKCTLYPRSRDVPNAHVIQISNSLKRNYKLPKIPNDPCDFQPFKEICKIIKQVEDHYPAQDVDGDHFSLFSTLRGTSWRGKDCNDLDSSVYPGRGDSHDMYIDTNCNGIVGIDPNTGESYEDLWCKGTQAMGSVILGDSVGAHFHVPQELIDPISINPQTYQYMYEMVENEFDWPMESAATGYMQSEWDPVKVEGKVVSLYTQLLERNRCNHRDYQNIAVNGADSQPDSMGKIVKTLGRNATTDKPVFIVLALIGNDVCNSHHSLDHMTTVTKYKQNMNELLDYLEENLPEKSVVLSVGLADGRVLYDSMHDRIHPAAAFSKEVNYKAFYNFLNCLEISPCFGWLNDNSTWRNLTTERAMNLSRALEEVVKSKTFKRIIGVYMDNPIAEMVKDWVKTGGQAWELIEPVDGFHTSRLGQYQTAKILYQVVGTKFPEILPPINPNNQNIEDRFGSQNGY